jgi:hypothetical protein
VEGREKIVLFLYLAIPDWGRPVGGDGAFGGEFRLRVTFVGSRT